MAQKKSSLMIGLGILIAVLVVGLAFFYGYSAFLASQLYGPKASVFDGWRNYVSFLLSQVPFVNQFVKYDPLAVLNPGTYFEQVYTTYKEQLEKLMSELQSREAELTKREEEVNRVLQILKTVEESWKEERLKKELSQEEDTLTMKRLQDIVDAFLESEAANLQRLMNSENMTVETLAVIFSKLPADTRAEMLQSLTAVNPVKAAQVVEKLGGVNQILSDVERKVEQLDFKIRQLVQEQSDLISIGGFAKSMSVFLGKMSYEELWNLIEKIQEKPEFVLYIISKVDSATAVRLLKDIKDKNEELFIEVLNKGARF